MNNKELNCRICGYNHETPIWGEDNQNPTFEICDCCGCEFGNDDYRIESIIKYRNDWFMNGGKWFIKDKKPKEWNIFDQLSNVLHKYKGNDVN